jgi:hypothetical protein
MQVGQIDARYCGLWIFLERAEKPVFSGCDVATC